jgi:hypothetical protein
MFIETGINDLLVFEPKVFEDERGYFFESYSKKIFSNNGINIDFVQDNQSLSSYGTIRGLHMQKGASAQSKLVRVLEGKVLDVAVDFLFLEDLLMVLLLFLKKLFLHTNVIIFMIKKLKNLLSIMIKI